MTFTGTIGEAILDLRVLNTSGVGQQLSEVVAEIYNSESELQLTVTFSESPATLVESSDSSGYLYEIVLDTTNPILWPGSLVRVEWATTLAGSPADTATFSEVYSFFPVASPPANKTVLLWKTTNRANLRGYLIYTKYPEDTDFVYLAFSEYPFFIDNTTYTPVERNRIEYQVLAGLWDVDGGDDPLEGDVITTLEIYQTDQALCVVTGTLTWPTGQAEELPNPRFFIHHAYAPVNVGNQYFYQASEVTAQVNNSGKFGAPLVRGTIIVCEIPATGYCRKFVVPDQAAVRLVDLTTTPVESNRAE